MDANITTVRRFFTEVVNGAKLDLIDEIMTPDYVMHAGSLGTYPSREKFKAFAKANAGAAFSGMHLEVQRIIADGNEVYVLFTNSGTNTGAFLGQPPTGKYAKWSGFVLFRLEKGRIAESNYVEDLLDMFGQLGIKKLPD